MTPVTSLPTFFRRAFPWNQILSDVVLVENGLRLQLPDLALLSRKPWSLHYSYKYDQDSSSYRYSRPFAWEGSYCPHRYCRLFRLGCGG